MGSKSRFTKELLSIILENREDNQWYVEPFVGGMNMISEVSGNRIANDNNPYLISMWNALLTGWEPPLEVSKEDWKNCRDNKDLHLPAFVGWCGFNCSYSGVFFGGYAGKTKTKLGTIRDYQAEAHKNINKQLEKLQGVEINYGDYRDLRIPHNSIIYCDPPYKGTSSYKTGDFNHEEFWNWCDEMTNYGNKVFVSEYSAPNGWRAVWYKEVKSSLSANGKSGGSKLSMECLFTK